MVNYMLSGKAMIIHLIDGYRYIIKIHRYIKRVTSEKNMVIVKTK